MISFWDEVCLEAYNYVLNYLQGQLFWITQCVMININTGCHHSFPVCELNLQSPYQITRDKHHCCQNLCLLIRFSLLIDAFFSLFGFLYDEECFPRCIKHVCCCWFGFFPFVFVFFFQYCLKFFVNSVIYFVMFFCFPPLQCCCFTVCFCDIAIFIHFIIT